MEITSSQDIRGGTDRRHASRRSVRARVLLAIGVAVGALGGTGLVGTPAFAGVTVGTAEITMPDGSAPLNGGGSASLYGVVLPAGAACPGDTAHHGYLIDSYLVPEGVAVTSVNFKTGIPSKGLGYIAAGAYFGAINTAEGTGQITTLPGDFTWSRWTARQLLGPATSAVWNGGIACANTHGVVTTYWNTEVRFKASSGAAGGFTWSVVGSQAPTSSSHGPWLVVGVVGALLILVGAVGSYLRKSGKEGHVDH